MTAAGGHVMSTPSNAVAGTGPVAGFSQCHVGIVAGLRQLGRLPALLEPARQARQIAAETRTLFRGAVCEHHAEEERELFPAVLASSAPGEERQRAQALVERLTREHRGIEAQWSRLEPELERIAKGRDPAQDFGALETRVAALVADYEAHAGFEEADFLPLAQTILGRNGAHMAALGMSLHLRHAVPELMARLGHRI
jgi:hypothetical protein